MMKAGIGFALASAFFILVTVVLEVIGEFVMRLPMPPWWVWEPLIVAGALCVLAVLMLIIAGFVGLFK